MNALQHALAQPLALWLLVLLPVLGILALLARRWGRRALWQFSGGLSALTPPSTLGRDGRLRSWRRALRTYGASTGLAFLALGIAGPQWGRDRDQSLTPGRDLVVVLDMSLSMLARDVPGPTSDSRLGQAVAALQDLANAAEKRGGHRLALVVFASRAKVVCPLTQDYDHFREGLGQLDPLDPLLEIGPVEDSGSGTRIGSALLESVKLLREAPSPGYQDILLLSDGDDPAQDEEWRLGVEAARKDKIPIHTIGLGDPSRPSLIPIPGAGDFPEDAWHLHAGSNQRLALGRLAVHRPGIARGFFPRFQAAVCVVLGAGSMLAGHSVGIVGGRVCSQACEK
jgi:Ca-activated chloride channel family protein